jgi:lipopolysaccharide/colanic/teichoic acid biosynthesis glycosyltransferase
MAVITSSGLEEQATATPTLSLNGEAAGRLSLNGHVPPAAAVPGYPLRRPVEVMLAFLGISVIIPAAFLIAALIWLDDRGPVFVRQTRVGRGGRLFHLFKFRTMREPEAHDVPRQATTCDGRITRVGRLLRATALDEVPQLLNILRGEMSFVGPRALLPKEVEVDPKSRYHHIEEVPNYHVRTSVCPGLTGLAQVYARRDISRQKKFKYDALYVRRISPWLDMKLFATSVVISLTGRWPRRGRSVRRRGAG